MKIFLTFLALLFIPLTSALAVPVTGEPAPAFSATDTHGNTIALSDFKGKIVVLEWSNHECPYVRKHYDSNNMQDMQKNAAMHDIIWLTIVSSAPGKQGHATPEEANAITARENATPHAKIMDENGTIGQLYGAKTTPHMFVIDVDGTLVYQGAIDSNPSTREDTIVVDTKNYVAAALEALRDDVEIEVASTKPYGCSVKY